MDGNETNPVDLFLETTQRNGAMSVKQVWKVIMDFQTSSASLRLGLEKMLGFEHPIRASPGFNMAAPSG